ncbi:HIT family protein [Philodulcilactobacillus myokoensis]|uniref:HIT family protein n=1 Tax=Philodulcilactobacillus myokoensis TaxID=2929573 RepID=A0A9W6B0Q7_9LACO|nr:HIT family protein [Philodulcilactobacillus myokoensis]GLB46849.1 HIT family protein [Philodulcilactobacillus myokoensis]
MIDPNCVFCQKKNIIIENSLTKAFYDIHPVSKGHVLIVPKDHVENLFQLTDQQVLSIQHLLLRVKSYLDRQFHPVGYNIGANCGRLAGQAVMHMHLHVIPRYLNQRPKVVNQNALRVPAAK